jgi:hypothetical protein
MVLSRFDLLTSIDYPDRPFGADLLCVNSSTKNNNTYTCEQIFKYTKLLSLWIYFLFLVKSSF